MLIKEITQPAPTTVAEPEPTDKDVSDITALLGTIDPVKEQPQTLLNKLTGWMKQYPLLDKVTDIIPQTRLIKAIAAAADAIEAGDSKTALNALAGIVGGGAATVAKAVNVAQHWLKVTLIKLLWLRAALWAKWPRQLTQWVKYKQHWLQKHQLQ